MRSIVSISTSEYSKEKVFDIFGVSYAGKPKDSTALFIGKKVEGLLSNLIGIKNCLVFVDKSINVPNDIEKNNLFIKCDNPQFEYAIFAKKIENNINELNSKRKYNLTEGGYYIGEDVIIGKNSNIASNVFIDHGVVIGENVTIMQGAKLSNCVIGDNCIINQNVVIGSFAPNVAVSNEKRVLIPMLGNVIIGSNVYIGVSVDIPRAMANSTIVKDNVVLGVNTSIGHDDCIGENTVTAANASIGGYATIGNNVYIGLGASVKNRISVGDNVYICMGSNVIRDVEENIKVFGNPAKKMVL